MTETPTPPTRPQPAPVEMFAVVDPNWGSPRIITETISPDEAMAKRKACRMPSLSLYSGQSDYPLPRGTEGQWSGLAKQHFYVAPVTIVTGDVTWVA